MFAWLSFASAYAGHEYCRLPAFRWAGIVTLVAVLETETTDSIDKRYFSAELRIEPVCQLVVDPDGSIVGSSD